MAVQNQRLMKSSLADNTVTTTTTTTTPITTQTTSTRNSNSTTVPSMTMPPSSSSTSSLPAKTLQATHTSAPTPTASPQIATHATINGGPRSNINHPCAMNLQLMRFDKRANIPTLPAVMALQATSTHTATDEKCLKGSK
uniref:Uncharacterized protein n=1 Tax=Glossina palpalis gambiensis TaxID=67801 RepID=A0A1B0C7K5_9MUSC